MANAMVRYSGSRKMHSWAKWFVRRTMHSNQNNLVSVVGRTGSGKTLSAISICEIMAKFDGVPFDVEKHVVFDLLSLMKLINSGELKKGTKIVCDEFQCSISAREFQSKANKVFNYLLTTFRHLNLTLFFCTPFETLLDKNTRKLFHARFETMSINKNTQMCRIKPRFLEHVDFKVDPYRKQMIIFYKDKEGYNKSVKLAFWDVPRPTKENEKIYEKMKFEFTSNLNKNILTELKSDKSMVSNNSEGEDTRKPLTARQAEVMGVLANIQGTDKFKQTSKILGITLRAIHQNKQLSEKKGYKIEEFVKNEKSKT